MRLSHKVAVVSFSVLAVTGTVGAASAQTNRYTQQQAGPPYDLFFDGGPVFGGPAVDAGYRPGPRERWARRHVAPPGYYRYGDEPTYGEKGGFF